MEVPIRPGQLAKVATVGGTLLGLHATIAAGWIIVPLAIIVAASLLAMGISLHRGTSRMLSIMLAGNALFFALGIALYVGGVKSIGHVLTLPSFLILGGLAFVFARSLTGNREPIVNHFMRLELGTVPEPAAGYGRALTATWALLLAAMAIESVVLSFLVDLSTWSWIVNVVNPALMVVFFVGQHLYGDRFLPKDRRASPLNTMKAMFRPQVWFVMRPEQPRRPRAD